MAILFEEKPSYFYFLHLKNIRTQTFLFPIITLCVIELQAYGTYMKSYDRLGGDLKLCFDYVL
jgi:hypothetical protein